MISGVDFRELETDPNHHFLIDVTAEEPHTTFKLLERAHPVIISNFDFYFKLVHDCLNKKRLHFSVLCSQLA